MIGGTFEYERCMSCQRSVHTRDVRRDGNGVMYCPSCYAGVELFGDHVAPHAFEPLRFWDAWHGDGRCSKCVRPKWVHPTQHYVAPRSAGDTSKARLPGARR